MYINICVAVYIDVHTVVCRGIYIYIGLRYITIGLIRIAADCTCCDQTFQICTPVQGLFFE